MKAITQKPTRRKLSRRTTSRSFDADMMVKLYELLQGERDTVKVYSKALGSEICFVNPAVHGADKTETGEAVYSTRELSFVMSLSPAELRRYHYLKMKLV